jgi:hypothetical protein
MAPLTKEERRAARAQQAVVQGVAYSNPGQNEHIGCSTAHPKDPPSKTSSKRNRPDTSMVVAPEVVEERSEPEVSEPAPYMPPLGTWHAELAIGKSGAADPSLWDVDFPFNQVLNQATTSADTARMNHLGIYESLQAMRAYSFWTSALANSTEDLCRRQFDYLLKNLQPLKDKVNTLERRCAELEGQYNHATKELEKAETDLRTSNRKLQTLRNEKSEIQTLLVAAQEARDTLQMRISELASQGVTEYDNGFREALDQVRAKFPNLDLDEIRPD